MIFRLSIKVLDNSTIPDIKAVNDAVKAIKVPIESFEPPPAETKKNKIIEVIIGNTILKIFRYEIIKSDLY